MNKAKIDRALLVKILKNPQVQFKVTPQNTFALADFMYRGGAIKHQPKSWKDNFFQYQATAEVS